MTEPKIETACDWTVSGMDCGSCATKIKDAVARLPGVSGVEVAIMSERLRLTLDERGQVLMLEEQMEAMQEDPLVV